jgi:nitrite reductase/ring-hydroxylating ferredoxin subunit
MNSVPRSSSKRLIASPVMERSCLIALVPLFPPEKVMGCPWQGWRHERRTGQVVSKSRSEHHPPLVVLRRTDRDGIVEADVG